MLEVNFSPFPTLETERLILRAITLQDAPQVLAMRSDERVMQYFDRPRDTSIADAEITIQKRIDNLQSNSGINWGITLKNDDTLIGDIAFWRIDKEHYRAEIGYMLHPDFQGKGIMQEALTKAIDYAFNILKVHSIEANVNPLNEASIKLLERNKFVREAYFRENFYYNGKFLDSAIYSLVTRSIS